MPDDERVLIARFLRANNYAQTLESFLGEAGLPSDIGSTIDKKTLTIEKLLQEKRAFDLAVSFEKLQTDTDVGWHLPAPSLSTEVQLPSSANILALALSTRVGEDDELQQCLLSSASDRHISAINCGSLQPTGLPSSHEAPVLTIVPFDEYFLLGDMAGSLTVCNKATGKVLARRRDHRKYLVKIATSEASGGTWIASAGWDARILLYWVPMPTDFASLNDPVANVELPTNPEAMIFVRHPDTDKLMLLLSRRDSTLLHYYHMPDVGSSSSHEQPVAMKLELVGRQNLAPHALSWVTFTPSDIVLCPTDPTKVAVATSSMPHMKVLIVRLLFPSYKDRHDDVSQALRNTLGSHDQGSTLDRLSDRSTALEATVAPSSSARGQLAQQNREEAAIMISCNTMAPQTQYSTPVVVWRPSGTGLFVSGDDGIIRGIEAATGKVMCKLQAHDPSTKVRCLWSGNINASDVRATEEWLVSGGFDQRLIVWRCAV